MKLDDEIEVINALASINPDDMELSDSIFLAAAIVEFAEKVKPIIVKTGVRSLLKENPSLKF